MFIVWVFLPGKEISLMKNILPMRTWCSGAFWQQVHPVAEPVRIVVAPPEHMLLPYSIAHEGELGKHLLCCPLRTIVIPSGLARAQP